MSLFAEYVTLDSSQLRELRDSPAEEQFELYDTLSETEGGEDIDKMWHALHFALTGLPGTTPDRDNPLSFAVLGRDPFAEDDDESMVVVLAAEVGAALQALEGVDPAAIRNRIDAESIYDGSIYGVDDYADREFVFAELENALSVVTRVYRKAAAEKRSVVFRLS